MAFCLHSADWWRRHWERSRVLDGTIADTLPDGWRYWRDWLQLVAPANAMEIAALAADAGRNLTYVRAVGRRSADAQLFDPFLNVPGEYTRHPLRRTERESL